MSARGNSSHKVCCFCNLTENNELEYGKFHEYNGIVAHYYCLLLSSNMEQKGKDDEGILGFLTEDIQKELRRGKRLACSYCKKIGATLGCCNVKCKRIFHFPCGLKAGSLHQYFGEFRSYCINHRPKQRIDEHILKQISSLDNILCCICYDKINPTDFVKTLWAPCCKKNAFFHRKCVQQLALSAGYFFKCPLCNNKQDFRNAMLEYGIFIPSQDASWELVPNAFEELLYRHDQCDAVKCLCPKGRKHVSSNAKWELTLCRTCGSQGIHMACGQLKWANPIWECTECTSILHNTKNNEDAESENSSDSSSRDSNLDSNSETDISVGMEFPVPCASPSFSSSSSALSLSDIGTDIRIRPGPRSFKLQQQMIRWLEFTHDAFQKDVTAELNQDTNASSTNDDKEKSLRNNENNTRKERQMSNNDITSRPIRKETDVITIESDDDNEVEIITLKRRTDRLTPLQSTSQLSIPHISSSKNIIKSQLDTIENLTSTCSNATSTNLLEKNDIELHKSVASKQNISNKSESTTELFDAATLRESTPDLFISNDNNLDNLDTENISRSPIMNIKITNVTSLPPEVFESVPDVALHENSIDIASPSTSKSLEKFVTYIAPPKRIYEEANGVTSNCKKVKGDNCDKKSWEKNSIQLTNLLDVVTTNASKQQNEKISPSKTNEIHENNNLLKCTSELLNESSNLSNSSNLYNQKELSTQLISFRKENDVKRTNQVTGNYSEGNGSSLNVQQSNENSVKARKTYLPSSKRKNQLYLSLGKFYPTSMPDSNLTINQDAEINRNMLHTLSNIILPNDFPTVSRSVVRAFNANVPVVANDNQTKMLDKKNTALMKEKIFTNVSSPGDSFSNNIFCDGDAGTCPAEIDSTGRKKTNPSSESCGSADSSKAIESHNPVATNSVFPRVTNNYSTCHQPRLIPQYMNLHDLKFRVCKPDNVQMVLYDTFSVNIPIKNSKESKIQSNKAAQWESKGLSYHASGEASSSIEYIDGIQTAEQRFFKLFRSSKNENLIHDKTKYIVHGQDDTKENLDPVRSEMLSCNDIFDNSLVNDICDTVTVHDSFCGEMDNEMHLVSNDTNLNTLNPTICNKNVEDSVMDGVMFVSNDRKQTLQVNWEDVQQHKQVSMYNMTPASTEEKIARPFCKETSSIVHKVDFDFNIVKTNKNIEKILQDDITVSTNRYNRDSNRKIGNDHTDDSQTMLLVNSYKHLENTNVMRPKVANWSATRVSNIMFNEHFLNKQIDTSDSVKFIRCLTFNENIVNRNSENNFRYNNSESFLKVSIDLCKIQSLIDSKPELFVNQKSNVDDKRRKCTS